MEYTQENHYSSIILSNRKEKKVDWNKFQRSIINIPSNGILIKDIKVDGKDCWILEKEYERLLQKNIDIEDINILTYVEGLSSPYGKGNSVAQTAMDGYTLHIIH